MSLTTALNNAQAIFNNTGTQSSVASNNIANARQRGLYPPPGDVDDGHGWRAGRTDRPRQRTVLAESIPGQRRRMTPLSNACCRATKIFNPERSAATITRSRRPPTFAALQTAMRPSPVRRPAPRGAICHQRRPGPCKFAEQRHHGRQRNTHGRRQRNQLGCRFAEQPAAAVPAGQTIAVKTQRPRTPVPRPRRCQTLSTSAIQC